MSWGAALPGVLALAIAVLGFVHNYRTLKGAQPKTDAEKQGVDIANLRSIIAELRQARADDRAEFARQIEAIHQDSATARAQAVTAHAEAEVAHREAAAAQHVLHQYRLWYVTDHLPWDQAVLAMLTHLDPDEAKNLPPRIEPPLWGES